MAKKRNNIVKFPKSPTRLIKPQRNAPPLEQRLNDVVNALIDRDGIDATYHSLADMADKMRKHIKKKAV
jgi:hypothetical protein